MRERQRDTAERERQRDRGEIRNVSSTRRFFLKLTMMKNRMDISDPVPPTAENKNRIGKEAEKKRLAKLKVKIADRKKKAKELKKKELSQLRSSKIIHNYKSHFSESWKFKPSQTDQLVNRFLSMIKIDFAFLCDYMLFLIKDSSIETEKKIKSFDEKMLQIQLLNDYMNVKRNTPNNE